MRKKKKINYYSCWWFFLLMKLEERVWRLFIIFCIKRSNSAFHCNTLKCCRCFSVIFNNLKPLPSIYSRVRTKSGYRVKGSNCALKPNLSFLKSDLNTVLMLPEQQVSNKAQTPFSVWLPLICNAELHMWDCSMTSSSTVTKSEKPLQFKGLLFQML